MSMLKIDNKLTEYIVTFLIIITLNFMIPRIMPGDPFVFLSAEEGQEVQYTAEQRQHYIDYYGLNKSPLKQYISYVSKLIMGDLGYSIYYKKSVSSIILARLQWTLLIVIAAVILSTIIGILLGCISAWYRERFLDKVMYFNLIFISEIPSFLVGLILLFVFAAEFDLFPLAGAMDYFIDYNNYWQKFLDILHHAFLPVAALTIARISGMYLLARNSIITILRKKYLRTARAKGLKKMRIIIHYVLRNALLPIVTRIFLSLGAMLGGAILVENVFAYPGLGMLMREAVMVRDYPLIQGIFLVVTFFVLTANFIADLVYKKLDPRLNDNDRINEGLT